jgi:hypothetical protein
MVVGDWGKDGEKGTKTTWIGPSSARPPLSVMKPISGSSDPPLAVADTMTNCSHGSKAIVDGIKESEYRVLLRPPLQLPPVPLKISNLTYGVPSAGAVDV